MNGGEIFIPKIPSIKIVDLAKAMAPNIKKKIIGVRPGEKMHELMCSKETYRDTLEFRNFYIILPYFKKFIIKKKLFKNLNENFKNVSKDFEYSSEKNKWFLNIKNIQSLNENIIK